MTSDCIPCIVRKLGEQVGMTPIAWAETETSIVIVFEQGPKLVFERKVEAEPEPVKKVRKPRRSKK